MIDKKIEYKKYFMNDIKKESKTIYEKYAKLLDNKIKIDDGYVDINTYIMSNIEDEVSEFIEKMSGEMSDIITRAKYSVIPYYYNEIFERTIDEYLNDSKISEEKIDAIIEILKNYYVGILFTK